MSGGCGAAGVCGGPAAGVRGGSGAAGVCGVPRGRQVETDQARPSSSAKPRGEQRARERAREPGPGRRDAQPAQGAAVRQHPGEGEQAGRPVEDASEGTGAALGREPEVVQHDQRQTRRGRHEGRPPPRPVGGRGGRHDGVGHAPHAITGGRLRHGDRYSARPGARTRYGGRPGARTRYGGRPGGRTRGAATVSPRGAAPRRPAGPPRRRPRARPCRARPAGTTPRSS